MKHIEGTIKLYLQAIPTELGEASPCVYILEGIIAGCAAYQVLSVQFNQEKPLRVEVKPLRNIAYLLSIETIYSSICCHVRTVQNLICIAIDLEIFPSNF